MPVTATKPPGKKKTIKRKSTGKASGTPANGQKIPAAKKPGKKLRVDAAHDARRLLEVPIDSVVVGHNDRKTFDPAALKRFANSISELGIISPLEVNVAADDTDRYLLTAGERRLRAAKLAKLKTVPVLVSNRSEVERSLVQLDENLNRVDLNAIEKAHAIKHRMDEFGLTQKEMAERLGCNQSQVSNQVRLLELPDIWQKWVAGGQLAATAARALVVWVKRPQVLQYLVDKFSADIDEGGFELSDRIIGEAVEAVTRSVSLTSYYGYSAPKANDCSFKFDAKKDAALDVEELPTRWGRKEKRAWNVDGWSERNAPGLKKRREQFKKAKAERGANNGTTSAKTDAKAPAFNEHALDRALVEQLSGTLGDMISQAKHKAKAFPALIFVAAGEMGYDLYDTICECAGENRKLGEKVAPHLMKMLTAVKYPAFALLVVQKSLQQVEQIADLRLLADLFDVDVMVAWEPTRDVLAAFSTPWLQTMGRDKLNLPIDQQPEGREAILDWLEVDWPSGNVPAEVVKMVAGK